jgi:DNA-directed RNA polymerase subunit RPC12/RpoP
VSPPSDDVIYLCPFCGARVERRENVIPMRCLLCGTSLKGRELAVQDVLPLKG